MPVNTVEMLVKISVPYETYGTPILDKKAEKQIRKWIKNHLNDVAYIPLYVESDKGGAIEDATRKVKIKCLDQ